MTRVRFEATDCEEARDAMLEESRDRRSEGGFALIVAILALLLLTFLGLTLATTTSTELHVALNYRWNTQALYNAEAGFEIGKRVLQRLNWTLILPPARGAYAPLAAPPVAPWPPVGLTPTGGLAGTRNWEMGPCDTLGNGVGYGVVLFDGATAYENLTTVVNPASPSVNGAFTLWIRRPTIAAPAAGQYEDDPSGDNTLVLTAEGVAPFSGANVGTSFARANQARRTIEVTVQRSSQPTPCDTRGGQIGGGPEGNNVFGGACTPLNLNGALGNVGFAPGAKLRLP